MIYLRKYLTNIIIYCYFLMKNESTHNHTRSPITPFVPTPINTCKNFINLSPNPSQCRMLFNNFDATPWRQAYDMPGFVNNYEIMSKLIENDQENLFDDMSLPMILENPNVNTIFQTPRMEKKLNFDQDDQPVEQINTSKKAKQEEPSPCTRSAEIFSSKRQPKTKFIDNEYLTSTAKKLNYQILFDEQVKKKSNKEKGLRRLSQRAHQIVLQMKSATYKEVALKLSEELLTEKQLVSEVKQSLLQGKEQQNIKRRVYDALNVLIALGKLNKQGRKIVANKNVKLYRGYLDDQKQDEIQEHRQIYQSYSNLNKSLQQKKTNMQLAKKKYTTLKSLVERNKTFELDSDKIIPFPIVGLQIQGITQENINFSQNQFHLKSSNKTHRQLDNLDIINYLYDKTQKQH